MGFNKRIFTKENIIKNINYLDKYLNVDAAYIKDEFSREVLRLFNEGKSKEEIIEYINENK